MECPVTYFEKNLIYDQSGRGWGVFKLRGFNYENLSENEKTSILMTLGKVIASITEAKILIIPTIYSLSEQYAAMIRQLDKKDVLYPYAKSHAEMTLEYVQKVAETYGGRNNDYDTYFVVSLSDENRDDPAKQIREMFDYVFGDPLNAISTFLHVDKRDIMESKVRRNERTAARILSESGRRLSMRPATSRELQYLLKRGAYRGIESKIRLNAGRRVYKQEDGQLRQVIMDWEPQSEKIPNYNRTDTVIRPKVRDTANLFHGAINAKHPRYLEIEHTDGSRSYQTFLVVSQIPADIVFPGEEWIYGLQNQLIGAEICIHFKNNEFREALKSVEKQKRVIQAQRDNAQEAGQVPPDDVLDSGEEAAELENELKNSRSPLTEYCISVCVSSGRLQEMEEYAGIVRQFYEDMDFMIERPVSDQLQLYLQHIPGTGFQIRDYNQKSTPNVLAGGIFGVSEKLGDDVGKYIGTVGRMAKPVCLDLGDAPRNNQSAVTTITGPLGAGKSVLGNLLAILNVIYGGFSLIFDPKNERTNWPELLPMLKGLINVITLGVSEADRGKLDPFNMYPEDFDRAAELAVNVICDMYDIPLSSGTYIVLEESCEKMKNAGDMGRPCLNLMCRILETGFSGDALEAEAKLLARRIRGMDKPGLSGLLFGYGGEQPLKLDNRMNILQILDLKLPAESTRKEDYSKEERQGLVLNSVLSNFASRFAMGDRAVLKTVLMDEAWSFNKTSSGRKMLDDFSRLSRSQYVAFLMNYHSILDIPENLKNTITYKFCFGTTDAAEAERVLEYLGMSVTPENISLLSSLIEDRKPDEGLCMFRDRFGRIGELNIDLVFQDIIEAFNTTPGARKEAGGPGAIRLVK